jgi:hypothetical protein
MNHRAMLELVERYAGLLESNGAAMRRADLERHFDAVEDRITLLSHARWQIEMVRMVIDRIGGESTAIRLLGSTQGLLMALGFITVAEVWEENKSWLDATSVRAFDAAMSELASAGLKRAP